MPAFAPVPTAHVDIKDGKLPILAAGDLTVRVVRDYEDSCMDYFAFKDIKDGDQVHRCVTGICDSRIWDWINGDHTHIMNLSFKEFVAELQVNYLPDDWPTKIRIQILLAHLNPQTTTFWDFTAEIQSLNSLLVGTPSWFNTKTSALCEKIEAGLDAELSMTYFEKKIKLVPEWHKWLDAICRLDEA